MKTNKILIAALLAALQGAAWAAPASCTLNRPVVAFPGYDVFSTVDSTTAPVLVVTCTRSATFTATISASTTSGSITTRQMKHATLPDLLGYNLYQDVGHTVLWGTAAGQNVTATGTGGSYTIYGIIPAGQDVNQGSYSDIVTIAVTP